jgi:hypothetical protein
MQIRSSSQHNHIFNNKIGIWLSKVVTASGLFTSTFVHVKKHIFVSP